MKAKLLKLISMLLVLASIISAFTVFAFANTETPDGTEDGETSDGTESTGSNVKVLYNRNFEEGWDADNGLASGSWTEICKGNKFFVDYEIGKDQNYNYFMRCENLITSDGHPQINITEKTSGLVMEFDIKVDDFCNTGMIYANTQGATTNRTTLELMKINNNTVSVLGGNNFAIGDEWVHLAYVFDYTDPELEAQGKFKLKAYIGGELVADGIYEVKLDKNGNSYGTALQHIRILVTQCKEADIGSNWCIDNLKVYTGVTEVLDELPAEQGCGSLVNQDAAPVITILGDSNDAKGQAKKINNGLVFKINTNYCLLLGERAAILTDENGVACGAPVEYGDNVIVPLQVVLDCIGFPSYTRPDGMSIDISTGDSATYITLDRSNATVGGVRVELEVAPFKYTDENGNQYVAIAIEDIESLFPGWYITHDSTGMIFLTEGEDDIISSDTDIGAMMGYAKRFVFDYPNADQIYEDVKEGTENFTHPYIYGDQDKFDELSAIYNAEYGDEYYNSDLQQWLKRYVGYADSYYEYYAIPSSITYEEQVVTDEYGRIVYVQDVDANGDPVVDANGDPVMVPETVTVAVEHFDEYVGRRNKPTQPYQESGGYDPYGGRMEQAGNINGQIRDLAFGFQLTHDYKYAKLAYQLALDMGEWMHWAPGHFLNCSQATMPMAQAYDWLYNAWVELGYIRPAVEGEEDTDGTIDLVADIIYKFGVYEGLAASFGVMTDASKIRKDLGFGAAFMYYEMTNNWVGVCSAGMITGALAIMSYDTTDSYKYTYEGKQYDAAYLLSRNVEAICSNGLFQYAPDGSYVESPGYWGYGTNHLMYGLIALDSTVGTDYGIFDGIGMDKTFYFAAHSESSDFRYHNYHDSDEGNSVDSQNFNFAAYMLGDPTLSAIRMAQIKNGKYAGLTDIFYYPKDLGETEDVPLDYYAKGVDLYCARSSWDKGAVYASMIGGANNVSHGQIDAGSFVYHNAGTIWFTDIGKENYNVPNLGYNADRYRYYRMKPEGNNTVTLTSKAGFVPFGQDLDGAAYATDFYSNEYGSYVTYNMAGVFGGYVSEARRGMMITNDRTTTIVQDEIVFKQMETVYWFGHYSSDYVDKVRLSNDRKTAYMEKKIDGRVVTLRVSLVSTQSRFEFAIMDTYTMVHDGNGLDAAGNPSYFPMADTFDRGEVGAEIMSGNQGKGELNRDRYGKLAIKGENVGSFEVAVVMEIVDLVEEPEVGYKWTPMRDWMPSTDNRGEIVEDVVETRDNIKRSDFPSIAQSISFDDPETHIRRYRNTFYKNLTHLQYIVVRYDGISSSYKSQYKIFESYKAEYENHVDEINSRGEVKDEIAYKVMGIV